MVAGTTVNDLDDTFARSRGVIFLGVAASPSAMAIVPEPEALATSFTTFEVTVVDGAIPVWNITNVLAPGGRQELHPAVI